MNKSTSHIVKKKILLAQLALSKAKVQQMYLCTRQQRELHELKKKLAEEELLRVTKTRTFEEKKAELELEKAAAEAELASLRLKVHKERSSEASVME